MAGSYEDNLPEITYPIVNTDNILIGRGGSMYRADLRKVLRPTLTDTYAMPKIADFSTWVSQNSATATDIEDGFRIAQPSAQGNTVNLSSRVRSVPAGSNWQVTIGCRFHGPFKTNHHGGLILRESATGKCETMNFAYPGHNNPANSNKWTSTTAFSANRAEQPADGGPERILWFRFTRAGTTCQFFYGFDGVLFIEFDATFLLTNFWTTAPDQWGLYLSAQNVATPNNLGAIDAFAWSEG